MKIRFTTAIANRRRGEIADLDDASARMLIDHGHAEQAGDGDTSPTGRRASRRPPTTREEQP